MGIQYRGRKNVGVSWACDLGSLTLEYAKVRLARSFTTGSELRQQPRRGSGRDLRETASNWLPSRSVGKLLLDLNSVTRVSINACDQSRSLSIRLSAEQHMHTFLLRNHSYVWLRWSSICALNRYRKFRQITYVPAPSQRKSHTKFSKIQQNSAKFNKIQQYSAKFSKIQVIRWWQVGSCQVFISPHHQSSFHGWPSMQTRTPALSVSTLRER